MAIFVAIAALLCLATVAVLLRPLWRDARGVALGMGVVMLASTGLLYMLVGTPRALDRTAQQTPTPQRYAKRPAGPGAPYRKRRQKRRPG